MHTVFRISFKSKRNETALLYFMFINNLRIK